MQKARPCKGIILAGGAGTRLFPSTQAVIKQLLPVYDKPMIYYPLTTLMRAGVKDILIITQSVNIPLFHLLFGEGEDLGIKISYAVQEEPRGLAEAFIIAGDAGHILDGDRVCMILGDNMFHGDFLDASLKASLTSPDGSQAAVFLTQVKDADRYGVAAFNNDGKILRIIEKPRKPPSNWAVTGLYVYPSNVVEVAKGLQPSGRGELEVTDLNNHYIDQKEIVAIRLGPGTAWLDTGTPEALLEASHYVQTIQKRQSNMVGCPEEAAVRNKWADEDKLYEYARQLRNDYGNYLVALLTT